MILIIDNYDSFTYNLVHLVAAVTKDYKVIRNDELTLYQIKELNPSKILISPGPGRPDNAGVSKQIIQELGQTTPILGVCLGHQAIGEVFGAKVDYAPKLMHGKVSQVEHNGKNIFKDITQNCTATRYHSLVLAPDSIPEVLEITARSEDVIMGIRHKEYPIEGIQFHPESILTTEGPKMITNWLTQS
ncbi:MAG: aminodeoxychorismate/anthranilate synthase component II [Balneola sp.]